MGFIRQAGLAGFFLPLLLTALAAASPGQRVTVDHPVFRFDPIPEGTRISHTFVLKNNGDNPLVIEKVMPP